MSRYQITQSKYLNKNELEHLEHICYKEIEENPTKLRNPLLILIALKTGSRAQELLNIKLSDINIKSKTIEIHGLKGSDDRAIPIHAKIFKLLMQYISNNNIKNDELLFPICYETLINIWELYRPCKKKFHSTRHTFAIELYKKTRDIKLVQMALGHRSIINTQVYVDYIYKTQELKRAVME